MAAIELGELRKQLKNDLGHTLDELLLQYEDRFDEYYFIVHTYWDQEYEGVMRSRIYVASTPGLPMVGTMCFHVDNKLCTIKQIWMKPLDGPQWEKEPLLSDEGVNKVGQEALASGVPLHD